MMKGYRVHCIWGEALLLGLLLAFGAAAGESISPYHQVTNQYKDTKNDNKSVVRLWQVETAADSVTEEYEYPSKSGKQECRH